LHITPPSSDDEDPEETAERLRKEYERQKIRELKQRRVFGEGSGGGLRLRGPSSVFVRRDVEDETAEVDIGIESGNGADGLDMGGGPEVSAELANELEAEPMDVDEAFETVTSTGRSRRAKNTRLPVAAPPTEGTLARPRRTPAKAANTPTLLPPKRGSVKSAAFADGKNQLDVGLEAISGHATTHTPNEEEYDVQAGAKRKGKLKANDPSGKAGKPKPETYKQAWTVEEQHELERLLEEIPAGEKNRFVFLHFHQ
jgi:hypothetical protein